ncbi:MAG: tripartite tricarboxylate transporter substrate binding protein [Acetobacteraceae bacterium]|nr:tripartite tricarboxylate transporter substrate binding protein [Acetobacteraceae bacterium]
MPTPTRRAAIAVPLALLVSQTAKGAEFPTRPVRIVVPFPPGGPTDTLVRLAAPRLEQTWGQPVVVENRGGAGGNIGTAAVARAAADGYTVLLVASSHAINPGIFRALPYDPVRDFAPVALLASSPFVLVVHPSVPARSLAELIALARARPGQLNYASASNGSGNHLAMEMLKAAAGIDIVHVPYAGAAPATTDLLAGQVPIMFNNMVSAMPHIQAGRLRALAVSGPRRAAALPDVPAVAETIPGFDASTWYGILAPAGTPATVVAELSARFRAAFDGPEAVARLAAMGLDPTPLAPDAFGRFIEAEMAKWGRAARAANVQVD